MFDPGEGLVLLVGTIVDIVEEEDIGFECEVPAGLAPKETRIHFYNIMLIMRVLIIDHILSFQDSFVYLH